MSATPKLTTDKGATFYDEAWDIRLSRLGIAPITHLANFHPQAVPSPEKPSMASSSFNGTKSSSGLSPSNVSSPTMSSLRCPPDGAASQDTSSSSTGVSPTSNPFSDADKPPPAALSFVASSILESGVPPRNGPDKLLDTAVCEEGSDDCSTPTMSSSWFPPPPPTPLHLTRTVHPSDAENGLPRRYHEHRKALELDEDDAIDLPSYSSDSISLLPLSPPPPPPPAPPSEGPYPNAVNLLERTSTLPLPLPPPALTAVCSAPAIPPRDPSTALQSTKTTTSLISRPPDIPLKTATSKIDNLHFEKPIESISPVQSHQSSALPLDTYVKPSVSVTDGRSVVPWEVSNVDLRPKMSNNAPLKTHTTDVDISEKLPQWVLPQYSNATHRSNNTQKMIDSSNVRILSRHRSAISQEVEVSRGSKSGLISTDGDDSSAIVHRTRPISLAARSSGSGRRRHTTSNFASVTIDDRSIVHPPQPRSMRFNSESESYGQSGGRMSGEVWSTPLQKNHGFEEDVCNNFVRVGFDHHQSTERSFPLKKSSNQPTMSQQLLSESDCLNNRQAPELMSQSLIMLSSDDMNMRGPAEDCDWSAEMEQSFYPISSSRDAQAARLGRRMRAVKLDDSKVLLSKNELASLQASAKYSQDFKNRQASTNQSMLQRSSKGFLVSRRPSDLTYHEPVQMTQSTWVSKSGKWAPSLENCRSTEHHSPQEHGYFLQTQISCPSQLTYDGSQHNVSSNEVDCEEDLETDPHVFLDHRASQTVPAQIVAFSGQSCVFWPPVVGSRRRRHDDQFSKSFSTAHSHGTSDHSDFLLDSRDKSSNSMKSTGARNGGPQVLVASRHRVKAFDSKALASLPIGEQPWFHGNLSRIEAESLLRTSIPGTFLVRTSETSKAAFSLSIRRDRDFLHMKITYDPNSDAYILGEYSQPYHSVPIMVNHYSRNLLPVRGTKPVLLRYPLLRSDQYFVKTP